MTTEAEWWKNTNSLADLIEWLIDWRDLQIEQVAGVVRYPWKKDADWKIFQARYALQRFETLSRSAVWDQWTDFFVRWSNTDDMLLDFTGKTLDEDELKHILIDHPLDDPTQREIRHG